MLGAMQALDAPPPWSEFVQAHVFDSDQVFAV